MKTQELVPLKTHQKTSTT